MSIVQWSAESLSVGSRGMKNIHQVTVLYKALCLAERFRLRVKNSTNKWIHQRRTGPWSIGPGRKMDGPGREYPDTPGPGRHFPARSEGVIVQKRKKFYVFFLHFRPFWTLFIFGWKILRKNILSPRKTPHPPKAGKKIYIFISCFMPFWALLNFSEKINI